MSGRYASQQSAIMLDVSQRDNSSQSSSPVSQTGGGASRQFPGSLDDNDSTVQINETFDVVQDSFEPPKALAKVNGDANEAPAPLLQYDDEDEMYGLSPKGQSQHEMTKAVRQSASKSQVIEGDRNGGTDNPVKDQQSVPSAATRSPTRTEPAKDSGPTQALAAPERSTSQHSQAASQTQAATEKLSAPATRLQKTSAAAIEVSAKTAQQLTQADVETSATSKKPVRAAKQSALEALRAKNGREQDSPRSAKAGNTSSTAVSQPKAPIPGPSASRKLPKKSKQLPTPITKATADRSDKRPATGKLPTHRPRSMMTPNPETINRAPEARNQSIAPSANDQKRGRGRNAKQTGTLKRPPKKDQAAGLREQQKVALRPANESHGKRGREGAKRVVRDNSRGGLRHERSDIYDLATSATKRQRRSMSRASKASAVTTAIGSRTRQRMQEASNQQSAGPNDPQPGKEDLFVQHEQDHIAGSSADKVDQPSEVRHEGDRNDSAENFDAVQSTETEKVPGSGFAGEEDTAVFLSERNSPAAAIAVSARVDQAKTNQPPPNLPSDQAKRLRPQTPAFRSSPPNTSARSALVPDSTKPSVISWDRAGPINQGTGRSSAPGSTQITRTVMHQTRPPKSAGNASSRQKLEDRRSNVQSSAAKPDKNTRNMHYTAPNVAADGEDVFSAFALGAKNSKLAKMLNPKPQARTSQQPNAEVPANEPDDDFANIDDLERTTMVDDQPPTTIDDELTVSQVAMPPPGGKARRAEKRVPKDEMTKDVGSVEVHRTPDAPSKQTDAAKVSQDKASAAPAPIAGTKRKPAPTADLEGATKRSKPDQTRSIRARDARAADSVSDGSGIAAQMAPIKLKQKPAKQDQPEPVKRALRGHQKPLRQASQGSVDITGSPYPKSMDVPKRSTALEVFSQQAGLSSDQDLERKPRSPADEQTFTLKQTVRLPLPSAELEALSSNSKPLPAPPQGMSQAVCHIASGATAERLPTRDQAREPPTDPFTSSEEQRQPDQVAHENDFLKALRESGFGLKAQSGMSIRSSNAAEDPDKTLLEPEQPRSRPAKGKKRAISISSDSSSDSSSQSQQSHTGDDVAAWRSTLKPHQADLFDSLVVVSHKLVRHLVDRETATADIVADYRRRGERIVSSLEKSSADVFEKRVKALADKRKQTGKELRIIKEKLQSTRGEPQSANSVAGARKKGRSKLEGLLQEMVATYA